MRRSRRISQLCYLLLVLCALQTAGCAWLQMPKIDPSGDTLFTSGPVKPRANTPYLDEPGGPLPWDDVAVSLVPQRQVMPVGSEVILLAGVVGPDNFYRMNRRLEWAISEGSVGNFVDVGQNGLCDLMVGDFNRPHKVNPTYAIGSTSRSNLRLNRGTATPNDDVFVLAGQGWISVTSAIEGTTSVHVYAPDVYPWDKRTQSAVIHWVDAQWSFPPPTIAAAGSKQTLTTSVLRQSDRSPCVGWRVRYEVADSPVAGFTPDGAPSVEVVTDEAGQATAEIFQKQPVAGTNRIAIQVLRPPTAPGAGGVALAMGNGSTMVTWTSAAVQVKKTGPAVGAVGAMLTYRTVVQNPGDHATQDLTVVEDLPEALSLVSSSPQASVVGRRLSWRVGPLKPNESRAIEVNCRAERPGSVNCCAQVMVFGAQQASSCATTTIGLSAAASGEASSKVDLKVTGPAQSRVGEVATFSVTVTSRLPKAETLSILDRFEQGLVHLETSGTKSIDRSLGVMEPNKPRVFDINFRVTQPGNLTHTVEIYAGQELLASQAVFLKADAAAAPGDAAAGAITPPMRSPVRDALKVTKTGPTEQVVGKNALFTIEVLNAGTATLSDVTITDTSDNSLEPLRTSYEHKRPDRKTLVWSVPQLRGGEAITLEVEYACKAASRKACAKTRATAATGESATADGCLAVLDVGGAASGLGGGALGTDSFAAPSDRGGESAGPAMGGDQGGLTLSMAGLNNPIQAGRTETYTIVVTNKGRAIDHLVQLDVLIPIGMTPSALGTTGPPLTKVSIEPQRVKFAGVPELRPGGSLTYKVVVKSRQPGVMKVRAELRSMNLEQKIFVEKVTEVAQ